MGDRQNRQRNRHALLDSLYESAEADVRAFVPAFDIGSELGMDAAETGRALAYLEEKGLVMVDDFKTGIVRVTATGIDVVESGGT
jgi:hypothetical protein